jgi:hypothetical protein
MVFINKTLSTETVYQQDLINRDLLSTRLIVGKVSPGMWCGKFNSVSNVLVCETQRKVNMYGCVGSVCVCVWCVCSVAQVSLYVLSLRKVTSRETLSDTASTVVCSCPDHYTSSEVEAAQISPLCS